jgi:hypothetical protein
LDTVREPGKGGEDDRGDGVWRDGQDLGCSVLWESDGSDCDEPT